MACKLAQSPTLIVVCFVLWLAFRMRTRRTFLLLAQCQVNHRRSETRDRSAMLASKQAMQCSLQFKAFRFSIFKSKLIRCSACCLILERNSKKRTCHEWSEVGAGTKWLKGQHTAELFMVDERDECMMPPHHISRMVMMDTAMDKSPVPNNT